MSIFTKLFLLLAGLAIVPLGAVALVLAQNTRSLKSDLTGQVDRAGDLVSDKGASALQKQVELTHLKIVQEKAARLEGFFEDIRAAVQLQGTLIQQFLTSDAPVQAPYPLYTADEVHALRTNDEAWRNSIFEKAPYTMYHLVAGVAPDAAKDTLHRLRQLGAFFAHTFRVVPGCATAYLGHRDGIILGYPGGSRFNPQYDPRQRPWYLAAKERRGIIWTRVYVDRGDNDLIVTCAKPVYSPADGSLLAVAAMDVRLIELIRELFALGDLPVSAAMLIDDEGRVRVSAKYEQGQTKLDRQTILEPPLVKDFADPGLGHAFEAIVAAGKTSGIVVSPPGAAEESLYAFATVRFRASVGGVAKPDEPEKPGEPAVAAWRYVVKVPLAPVIRPAQEIRADIRGVTGEVRSTIEEQVGRQAMIVGAIMLLTMGAAMALAFVFAGRATRPLIEMERVSKRIAVGDFNQQVHVHARDEIGTLGKAINDMIVGLKEREFVKKTFKRFVAASVVEELIRDPSKSLVHGERKILTVFFSDLSGFTTISERLPAAIVVQMLNEYLSAMTDAILAQEGTFDKYIGDAIVAFWGAPLVRADDAARACRTALMQLSSLRKLWPDWERRGLPKLDVRIGIQTGPVVVGNIGSDTTQVNYTVIGDTANTTSRLEGANKIYGTRILIGEGTRQAAGEAVVVREIDLIVMMGKQDAVRVYELAGLAGEVPPQRLDGLRTYESGLAAYRARQWDEAEAQFNKALAILGDDAPSRAMLKRVQGYRAKPPEATWNGTFVMTEK